MTCNTRRRTVIKGTHLLRSALLALLALAVISGGSLARGDLFDDDYNDCPHRTRLRDGQIDDLSVNRDSEEEDEVNVAWSATDPATWGLGANAYSTSLVVILDDGSDTQTETLSLGSRSTTFSGVETGTEVTVQMAIVVDTADGDYLISDILSDSINQSLTAPSFSATVMRVQTIADSTATPPTVEVLEETPGTMYYVGYNENFGNYKADTYSITTQPVTARLRIGLANTELDADGNRYASDEGPYDEVDFDAYIVRITDEDGDVVSEGDDVPTRPSSYPDTANRLVFGVLTIADGNRVSTTAFSNVRIDDGAQASVQDGGPVPGATVIATGVAVDPNPYELRAGTAPTGLGLSYIAPDAGTVVGSLFAMPPNEHRDFPTDTLSSDVTYTITAWAINDDDEVISPVASLEMRPIDERVTLGANLTDYVGDNGAPAAGSNRILITEFTVLD